MLSKQADIGLVPAGDGLTWLAVLSSPEPDCAGDRLMGWTWTNQWLPLLLGHDAKGLPVGLVRPYVKDGRLLGEIRFPAPGTSAAADEARALVEVGVVSAVSIGFNGEGTSNAWGGKDFTDARVREVSLVGAGCCESCHVTGRKCRSGESTVLWLLPDREPAPATKVYSVDPGMLAKVIGAGVRQKVAERVAYARGRLDYEFGGRIYQVGGQ